MPWVFNPFTSNFDATTTQVDVSGFATRELDNLTTTAVNTNLNPDTDATHNFGSNAAKWNQLWGSQAYVVAGNGDFQMTYQGIIFGYVGKGGAGSSSINQYGYGALYGGYVYNAGSGTAYIGGSGYATYGYQKGAMAIGGVYASGTSNASIQIGGYYGGMGFGFATASNGSTALIKTLASGAIANGYCIAASTGYSEVYAGGSGSFASGSTNAGGSGRARIRAINEGTFAQGIAVSTSSAFAQINVSGVGGFSQGNLDASSTGNIYLNSSANGAFSQGSIVGQNGGSHRIEAGGTGSFAQGAIVATSNRDPNNRIQSTGNGAACFGYIDDTHNTGAQANLTCYIQSTNAGSFAQGSIKGGGDNTLITSSGRGSLAQGYAWSSHADSGGAYILSGNNGSHASGFARSTSTGGYQAIMRSTALGSFARGWVRNNSTTADAIVDSSGTGSAVFGRVRNQAAGGAATLSSTTFGSFAFGNIDNAVAGDGGPWAFSIEANGYGSFAGGSARTRGTNNNTSDFSIKAQGEACFAFGSANNSYLDIYANGTNTFQFGVGSNTQTESFQFGRTFRQEFSYGETNMITPAGGPDKTVYSSGFDLLSFIPDSGFSFNLYNVGASTAEFNTWKLEPVPLAVNFGYSSGWSGEMTTLRIAGASDVSGFSDAESYALVVEAGNGGKVRFAGQVFGEYSIDMVGYTFMMS